MSSAIYKKTYIVDSGGHANFTNASQDYGDPRHEKSPLAGGLRIAGLALSEPMLRIEG
jgi:hypothetical protein